MKYILTSIIMISALQQKYPSVRPIETTYKYSDGNTMYVMDTTIADSLGMADLCNATFPIDSFRNTDSSIMIFCVTVAVDSLKQ